MVTVQFCPPPCAVMWLSGAIVESVADARKLEIAAISGAGLDTVLPLNSASGMLHDLPAPSRSSISSRTLPEGSTIATHAPGASGLGGYVAPARTSVALTGGCPDAGPPTSCR